MKSCDCGTSGIGLHVRRTKVNNSCHSAHLRTPWRPFAFDRVEARLVRRVDMVETRLDATLQIPVLRKVNYVHDLGSVKVVHVEHSRLN